MSYTKNGILGWVSVEFIRGLARAEMKGAKRLVDRIEEKLGNTTRVQINEVGK